MVFLNSISAQSLACISKDARTFSALLKTSFVNLFFLVWLSLAMLLPMTALELSLNLLLQSRGIAPSSSFSLLITVSFLRTVLGAIRRMAAAAFGLII
jgi:hypothetical protein